VCVWRKSRDGEIFLIFFQIFYFPIFHKRLILHNSSHNKATHRTVPMTEKLRTKVKLLQHNRLRANSFVSVKLWAQTNNCANIFAESSKNFRDGGSFRSIDYRIFYKLCLIMHFVHTNRAPQYPSDCVQTVVRSSNPPGLRSSYTAAYAKPRCRTKFGERGFRHAGPTAWNSLPDHLHQISDTSLFKRRLKTELFRRAYHR